jgi:hypothetical protein
MKPSLRNAQDRIHSKRDLLKILSVIYSAGCKEGVDALCLQAALQSPSMVADNILSSFSL